jgi:hypothetical protein
MIQSFLFLAHLSVWAGLILAMSFIGLKATKEI